MPMYEFKCGACGQVVERYCAGGAGEAGKDRCPQCGKGPLQKVFSTFASSCGGGASAPSGSSGGCGGGSSHFS